jgi:hypothetical protein
MLAKVQLATWLSRHAAARKYEICRLSWPAKVQFSATHAKVQFEAQGEPLLDYLTRESWPLGSPKTAQSDVCKSTISRIVGSVQSVAWTQYRGHESSSKVQYYRLCIYRSSWMPYRTVSSTSFTVFPLVVFSCTSVVPKIFEDTRIDHLIFNSSGYNMHTTDLSADTVAAIVLGILQLGIGLLSLWQQRRLRQAYRKHPRVLRLLNANRKTRRKRACEAVYHLSNSLRWVRWKVRVCWCDVRLLRGANGLSQDLKPVDMVFSEGTCRSSYLVCNETAS